MKYKSILTRMKKQALKDKKQSFLGWKIQWSMLQIGGILDKTLFVIAAVAEYIFIMHIGVILGWLVGLWVGNVYFDNFPPEDSSKVFVLTKYGLIPYTFAKNGAIIGVFVSIIVLVFINKILFVKEVTGLYEQGVTNSKEIAQQLGHSVWRVERTTKKFNNNNKPVDIGFTQNENKSGIILASVSSGASSQQSTNGKTDNSLIACGT